MCTSVILFRKEHAWPLLIGSNRDEKLSKKSKFPAKHWPKQFPNIIGGYDEEKGGTWIAINNNGLVSIIHNRSLEKNNNIIKRTRGHIILELLNFEKIEDSIKYLQNLNQNKYNGFNIIIGDKSNCFWGKHTSVDKKVYINEVSEGLSVLTDKDLNDVNDKKTSYYLNKFSQAPIPDPSSNNWLSWELLLATNQVENQKEPRESICFADKIYNFGTISSSIISIPNLLLLKQINNPIIFKHSLGSPCYNDFEDVETI